MAQDDFELADFLPSANRPFAAMALDFSDQPANIAGATRLAQILLWQARTMSLWRVALAQEAHNAACALEHQGAWSIGLQTLNTEIVFELTPLNVGLTILDADAFMLRNLLERCRLGQAADPSAHWPHWAVTLTMQYRQRLLDALVESAGELVEDSMAALVALKRMAYLNLGWVLTLGANDDSSFIDAAWQAHEYRRMAGRVNGSITKRTRLTCLWGEERPFAQHRSLTLV